MSKSPTQTAATQSLRRVDIVLFAIACGLAVANVYLAQPLLDAMAIDFGVAPAAIGAVVTMTQVGYGVGLIVIVPLGDMIDRRRLILAQAVLSCFALAAAALASHFATFLLAMAAVGLLAVAVQVLVAFAAALAGDADRGKVVGSVTSGVVAGILLARFAAGLLADFGGWRLVYAVSAALTLVVAALLARRLPRDREKPKTSYAILLRSTLILFAEEPILRLRALFALMVFATMSTFWTAMVLPLSTAPFALSHTQIGLLALARFAGAIAAAGAGRLADRGLAGATTGMSLLLMFLSWLPIAMMQHSLLLLILGVVLLDLAVQAVHVTNQSIILKLRPEAGSRIIGGYMVFYSIGSGLGAIGSTTAYGLAGWAGTCVLGAGLSAIALTIWMVTASKATRPRGKETTMHRTAE